MKPADRSRRRSRTRSRGAGERPGHADSRGRRLPAAEDAVQDAFEAAVTAGGATGFPPVRGRGSRPPPGGGRSIACAATGRWSTLAPPGSPGRLRALCRPVARDRPTARPRVAGTPRRRPGRRASAPGRPSARASGDLLVGSRRRSGQMPGTAVRVGVAIGLLRQCEMDRPAFLRRSRPVDGRAGQRVTEPRQLADREQPARLDVVGGRRRDAELRGRAPEQQRVAERLRRREQQQAPRVVGVRLHLPDEARSVPDGSAGSSPKTPRPEVCSR